MADKPKNILVTGGAGFIGSNFIHIFLENFHDCQIINLDALTYAGNLENLSDLSQSPNYQFINANICDAKTIDSLFKTHKFDAVVHFAAESHVDKSIENPLSFVNTNVVGTAILLQSALSVWSNYDQEKRDAFRFLHISTDEVFGSLSAKDQPFSEVTPYAPNSPYAASKASADHLARSFFHTYGLPVIVTNCSNNYGPYQFPEKMIPLMISNATNGKPLPVYGDGLQIRDWLFVRDHCTALSSILFRGAAGNTYSIGGNNQPTNLEIVHKICEILDNLKPLPNRHTHKELIQFVQDRPGHDRRYAMNISKIQKELGWQPQTNLEDGLYITVKWYLNHPEWIRNILNRSNYRDWMRKNYQNRGKFAK